MKIGIISPIYPFRGGISQFGQQLYDQLEAHHEIKVYSYSTLYPSFLFPGKSQYVDNPQEVIDQNHLRILNTINPISYLKTANAINKFAPDVLILVYWFPYQAPALGTIARFTNKNILKVGFVHNALPHEKTRASVQMAKYFFSSCDAFITLSNYVEKDIKSMLSKPKPTIVLNHPVFKFEQKESSYSTALRNEISGFIDCKKKKLLFFGLIRKYKGLDLLIEAMKYLTEDFQLLIVGECYENIDKYKLLINESIAKDRIHIVESYVHDYEIPYCFNQSDLLVLPYKSATQSGVLATAIEMQTPIVSTNVGDLGKAVEEMGIGIVSDGITAKSIASAIVEFFKSDKDFTKALLNNKEKLTFENFANEIIIFVKQHIDNKQNK